jgi:predicted CopG family antitoxin
MPTKTISVELDAYNKLRRARRNPRESFSSVIRRAVWPAECHTAAQLSEALQEKMKTGEGLPDEDVLDRLDAAQKNRRRSKSGW